MNFLQKLQKKPEGVKKLIVWGVCGLLVILFGAWWFLGSMKKIQDFPKNQFTPLTEGVQKETDKLKDVQVPDLNLSTEDAEALKALENSESIPATE